MPRLSAPSSSRIRRSHFTSRTSRRLAPSWKPRGVEFLHAFDSGVCHQAVFKDPDGNVLILHHRYAPKT